MMLLRIRGFCVFEFVNSAQQQPVCYLMPFFCVLSSSQDSMHCALSLTVCKCTPCQRASFNSTTDSLSWGHDPYTLACKGRPSFNRCWTSLSVSLSLSSPIPVFIISNHHRDCALPRRRREERPNSAHASTQTSVGVAGKMERTRMCQRSSRTATRQLNITSLLQHWADDSPMQGCRFGGNIPETVNRTRQRESHECKILNLQTSTTR